MGSKTLNTLYHVLNLKHRIEGEHHLWAYLMEKWGLTQKDIADWNGIHEMTVSRKIKAYKEQGIFYPTKIVYDEKDIKLLHQLPRHIIDDLQLYSFVTVILDLHVKNPFYHDGVLNSKASKVKALSEIGVRNKFIENKFNMTQAHVSVAISKPRKRKWESYSRSDEWFHEIKPNHVKVTQKEVNKFLLAGGQNDDN